MTQNINTSMLQYHFKFTCKNCGWSYQCWANSLPESCTRYNCKSKNFDVVVYSNKGEHNAKNEV